MSSVYLTRAAILADMQTRLKAAALPLVDDRVYASRVTGVPEEKFPAVLLYAPDRRYDPLGSKWEFGGPITIAVEIQVRYSDALSAGQWAAQAETIMNAVLACLLGSSEWRNIWSLPPAFAVKQYLRRDNVAVPHVGETLTITGTPVRNLAIPLVAQPLDGVDIAVRRLDQPDDAEPDFEISLNVETAS